MFIFEEIISRSEPISLNDYIMLKKNSISHLNSRYLIKVNNKIINKKDYDNTLLNSNDKIMIYPLLGGG